MRTVTLQDIRLDCRDRADMPRARLVSDQNLDRYINDSVARVYKMLVAARGQDYYMKDQSFTTDGRNPSQYALNSDFWQLVNVTATDGTFRRTLRPFTMKERARWQEYAVPAGLVVTYSYVPAPDRLTDPDATFDGIAGWEEWVVLDAAMKMLEKEETDTSAMANRRAELTREIELLAPDRDAGWPERVTDVGRGWDYSYAFGGGLPRYRLFGASGVGGANQALEVLLGPAPWVF